MVEEIMPCPNCGGIGRQSSPDGMVMCAPSVGRLGCFIMLPIKDWNALSYAAELARAVEQISNRPNDCYLVNAIVNTKTGAVEWGAYADVASGHAPTLAAALIALAKQVQE